MYSVSSKVCATETCTPTHTHTYTPTPPHTQYTQKKAHTTHTCTPPLPPHLQGDLSAYADDCLFADPFAGFRGVRRFKNNVSNLGSLMYVCV